MQLWQAGVGQRCAIGIGGYRGGMCDFSHVVREEALLQPLAHRGANWRELSWAYHGIVVDFH